MTSSHSYTRQDQIITNSEASRNRGMRRLKIQKVGFELYILVWELSEYKDVTCTFRKSPINGWEILNTDGQAMNRL